jgi:hypothetical protein
MDSPSLGGFSECSSDFTFLLVVRTKTMNGSLDHAILHAMRLLTVNRLADMTQPPNVRDAWLCLHKSLFECEEIILAGLPESHYNQGNALPPTVCTGQTNTPPLHQVEPLELLPT